MFASQLEIPGSPFEQTSDGIGLYTWDPGASGTQDLNTGETPTSPTAIVYQMDPQYWQNQADWKNVTSTVLVSGWPQVVSNTIEVSLQSLTAGYDYLCVLTFTATALSHLPSRWLLVRCKV